jgi:hypothetical protein
MANKSICPCFKAEDFALPSLAGFSVTGHVAQVNLRRESKLMRREPVARGPSAESRRGNRRAKDFERRWTIRGWETACAQLRYAPRTIQYSAKLGKVRNSTCGFGVWSRTSSQNVQIGTRKETKAGARHSLSPNRIMTLDYQSCDRIAVGGSPGNGRNPVPPSIGSRVGGRILACVHVKGEQAGLLRRAVHDTGAVPAVQQDSSIEIYYYYNYNI